MSHKGRIDRVPRNDIGEIVGLLKSQLCCIARYDEEERGAKKGTEKRMEL